MGPGLVEATAAVVVRVLVGVKKEAPVLVAATEECKPRLEFGSQEELGR